MSVRESNSSEHDGRGYAPAVLLGVFAVLAVAVLPFVPLLLSLLEHLTLGTNRVEDYCRQVGVHDELSALYRSVLWFLK